MTGPYYAAEGVTLHLGDSLDVLPTLADASVDAIVCDPPYALTEFPTSIITDALTAWLADDRAYIPATGTGFMGRDWDRFVPPPAIWDECLRVLKPGGHLLAFAGARTVDLMGLSIRLAGLQIRDSIDWVFGSGMPKGKHQLKPAHEPIIVARKSPVGSLTATIGRYGTGALNIDGCRTTTHGPDANARVNKGGGMGYHGGSPRSRGWSGDMGRWPTNVVLTHPPLTDGHGQPVGDACADRCVPGCPVAEMDAQTAGKRASKPSKTGTSGKAGGAIYGGGKGLPREYTPIFRDDEGGASRFFPIFRYEAKAPASERPRLADGTAHTTVKPLALMQWLVRLVTPPGGTVLDPFAGSGTTLAAALREGMTAIGVEKHEPYAQLCVQRLAEPYSVALFGDTA